MFSWISGVAGLVASLSNCDQLAKIQRGEHIESVPGTQTTPLLGLATSYVSRKHVGTIFHRKSSGTPSIFQGFMDS